jgi:dTDP-4-dehydrorhamnose reductase
VAQTLAALREERIMPAANDVSVSPTYIPDLIIECLNLLFDNETGIFHLANEGTVTWAEFAQMIAGTSGFRMNNIDALPLIKMKRKAQRPRFSALTSEKGIRLPALEDALNRYFEEIDETLVIDRIAV